VNWWGVALVAVAVLLSGLLVGSYCVELGAMAARDTRRIVGRRLRRWWRVYRARKVTAAPDDFELWAAELEKSVKRDEA
jgi:hypothetical protein